jgi:hypothetical protein
MDHYTPFGTDQDGQDSSANQPSPAQPAPTTPSVPEAPTVAQPEDDEPSQVDFLKSIMPAQKPKSKWPMVAALVVLLLVLACAGYYLFTHKSKTSSGHKTKSSQKIVADANTGGGSLTKYVSNGNDLNLDFDYPANWTVAPPSNDNSNDQTITVTSPLTSLTDASGTGVIGKVEVLVRPGSATLSELNGGATEAQNSTQIAYSQPTSDQHQYPYLSFLHLGTGNSNSFQEVIISGESPYTAGQAIGSSDIQVDPIISASFYNCAAQICTGTEATPLAITNDEWQSTPLYQQALAIIESMQLN